jgi:hypothetical protein
MARRPIRTTCRPGGRSISSSVRVCAGRSPQWPRGVVRARSQSRGTEPVNEADCAVQLGEGLGEIVRRQVQCHRDDRDQPRRHRLHRGVIRGRRSTDLRHVRRPAVEADQRLLIDEPSSPPTLTGWRQGMVVRNGLTAGGSRIRNLGPPATASPVHLGARDATHAASAKPGMASVAFGADSHS